VLAEEAADKKGDHSQDMDMEVAGDRDQGVEAEAAGSYLLEDRGGSDRPGERGPGRRLVLSIPIPGVEQSVKAHRIMMRSRILPWWRRVMPRRR
jgi:hypothetical protein